MSVKEKDQYYIANTYARFPVEIVSGKGSVLYDENGKEYIDMGSGIAVNIFGTKNVKARAIKYPGIRKYRIEIPVSTRIMARPTDIATPIERLSPIALAEIAPDVISSTCLVST